MIFADEVFSRDRLRARIGAQYRADETAMVEALVKQARLGATADKRIARTARKLVSGVREKRVRAGGIDAFLHEYGLSNREGIVLMCLAEALLRIPDAKTANRLIRDKIGAADWKRHLGHSDSLLVNASTWGLILTGRVVRLDSEEERDVFGLLGRLVARSGEPVIRQAINGAIGILSRQYVMGRTIGDALDRAAAAEEAESLEPWARANLRDMRRRWRHESALEPALVEALSKVGNACEMVWREARAKADFAMVLPKLEELLGLTRQAAAAKAVVLGCPPYDALLDQYEPGGSSARIDAIFDDLAAFLPEFLGRVLERQAAAPAPLADRGDGGGLPGGPHLGAGGTRSHSPPQTSSSRPRRKASGSRLLYA